MKLLKVAFVSLVMLLTVGCLNVGSTASTKHVEFKIGKKGMEDKLAESFSFQDFSVGTYVTTKNQKREQGVSLTFKKDDLNQISDSIINVYSNTIRDEVKANLLHLSDYDYINITFEQEVANGDFKKINSIKIKKQLK